MTDEQLTNQLRIHYLLGLELDRVRKIVIDANDDADALDEATRRLDRVEAVIDALAY